MKRILFLLAFISVHVIMSAQAGGPNCASAVLVDCGAAISGNTADGPPDGWTTGNNEGTGGQLWYYFNPCGSGPVTVSLCDPGSGYDTRVHIYSGSCGSLTFVAQDDDACALPGLASEVTWTATLGVTYYIRVGGFSANFGNYVGVVTCNSWGCTYEQASNYNPCAGQDDGSCIFDGMGSAIGCTDSTACNYCNLCATEDGSCDFSCLGCTYPDATNYDAAATRDDGSCTFPGCTDPESANYNPLADVDDGSCSPQDCDADFDSDGIVSVEDLIHFIGAYGTLCPE